MAEAAPVEPQEQAAGQSVASSPDSTSDAATTLKAPKDRNCPFCKQAFTSSSLGRHLDLFVRPRNPKPPDGVHDVDEIRKIRGGITRRQAKGSVKAATVATSSQTASGEQERKKSGDRSAEASPAKRSWDGEKKGSTAQDARGDTKVYDGKREGGGGGGEGLKTYFNQPTWFATGVINDLPPREPSRASARTPLDPQRSMSEPRVEDASRPSSRQQQLDEGVGRSSEPVETGRAAELALRELLASLEAAKKKTEPVQLYEDFEFCSMSFPGLCLVMLPPPQAIFSSVPFPVAHTWALTPPSESQWLATKRALIERIATVRRGNEDLFPDYVSFGFHVHLDAAYEQWQTLSDTDKATAWGLEIARAFAREQKRNSRIEGELELAQQRVRHLEAEYDRIARCQLPREYLLHPPNTVPMSPAILRELKPTGIASRAAEVDYDADALLTKWRATVKSTARPPRPPAPPSLYVETQRSDLKSDMFMNGSVFGVGGPMPRDSMSAAAHTSAAAASKNDHPDNRRSSHPPEAAVTDEAHKSKSHPRAPSTTTAPGAADADGDAHRGALLRRHWATPRESMFADGGRLNVNGKRPRTPSSLSGKRAGPRVYREQPG